MNDDVIDSSLEQQIEAVQLSIYCDIISNLLATYRSISIIKVAVISFVIKKSETLQIKCYRANNTNDLVLKFLSQVSGRSDEFFSQLKYIIEAIDILIKGGICEIHESELLSLMPLKVDTILFDNFTHSAIKESITYTDRQFLKEVITIV